MSSQILLEKFGGFATINMNGWQLFLAVHTAMGVPIVPVRLFAGKTVYKRNILNCASNGTQLRTEILHRRILPLVAVEKFGGSGRKTMIGKRLLNAELRELDVQPKLGHVITTW